MRLFITPIFIFLVVFGHSQTIESILKNYEEQLNLKHDFQTKTTYTLYEGNTGNKVLEKLDGISAKFNQAYYSKIGPTEFIFNEGYSLKISHAEKVMLISDAAFKDNLSSLNISSALFSQFASEEVKDKGRFWECRFSPKKGTTLPYYNYIIHFSKTNYKILKQVLFFSKPIKHKDENKEQYIENQRLEIDYNNQLKKEKISKEKFLLHTYVSLSDTTYEAEPIIGGYQIINTLKNTLVIN